MSIKNCGRLACRSQLVKKASQSLPPLAANRVQSVFCRGVYLAENTYARSRLPEFVGKAQRGFSTVSLRQVSLPQFFYACLYFSRILTREEKRK